MVVYAVDAGGSRIKLAAVEGGRIVARSSLEARAHEGLAAALPRIAEALRRFKMPAQGISLAFPSLTEGNFVVGDVGKYRDAEALDLAEWAWTELRLRLVLENDARAAAIGEWQHGAGQGTTDMVMVTLGTGIGTGVISEGRVLRGKHGAAGILGGHMTARLRGRDCPCGNVGCWETEASTVALPAMVLDPLAPLGERGQGVRGVCHDYKSVFAAAENGDPTAIRLRDHSLDAWGSLAVSLIHAYDPEILVFGGGVMEAGEAILSPVREKVRRHAWTPWGKPKVVASILGYDAALLGGEWLFMNSIERK
ncbi:ROK family protein [soil metagenome]